MDQIVEAVECQQVLADPEQPPVLSDFHVPGGGRQGDERREDDERHPVSQRVLVNLKPEGAEREEPEDCREDFRGEQPQGSVGDPADGENRPRCNGAAAQEACARQHDDRRSGRRLRNC